MVRLGVGRSTHGISVRLEVCDTSVLTDEVTALLWRGAQEAVRNVSTHSEASALSIRVHVMPDAAVLEVSDNGRGFDPTQLPPAGHFGLRGLRDLATEAGGRLDVVSAPGEGTRVEMEVPVR